MRRNIFMREIKVWINIEIRIFYKIFRNKLTEVFINKIWKELRNKDGYHIWLETGDKILCINWLDYPDRMHEEVFPDFNRITFQNLLFFYKNLDTSINKNG